MSWAWVFHKTSVANSQSRALDDRKHICKPKSRLVQCWPAHTGTAPGRPLDSRAHGTRSYQRLSELRHVKEFSSPPRDAHKDSASLVWALEATAATDLATKGHRDNSVFMLAIQIHWERNRHAIWMISRLSERRSSQGVFTSTHAFGDDVHHTVTCAVMDHVQRTHPSRMGCNSTQRVSLWPSPSL